MKTNRFTARYEIIPSENGDRYVFFCDLTGEPIYATDPIPKQDSPTTEDIARSQARPHFNRCSVCGKWVGDAAYNIDEMKCIACASAV